MGHKDTRTQRGTSTFCVPSCLCALVAKIKGGKNGFSENGQCV
jgi:hypothetical protein